MGLLTCKLLRTPISLRTLYPAYRLERPFSATLELLERGARKPLLQAKRVLALWASDVRIRRKQQLLRGFTWGHSMVGGCHKSRSEALSAVSGILRPR